MKVFLVRHGETTWNAAGKIQGKSNTHLSPLGKKQAKQIALVLKAQKFDAIYSSPLKRALDTAKEIAKHHKELEIIKKKELEEINYGMFEKMTFSFIDAHHKKLWAERRKHKYYFKPKNGESFAEMDKNRIKPFVQEIKKKHDGETICIVAHSGTNRLVMGSLLGLFVEAKVNIWQPNECYYEVDTEKKTVYRQCIDQKPVKGWLNVRDMEYWDKMFK